MRSCRRHPLPLGAGSPFGIPVLVTRFVHQGLHRTGINQSGGPRFQSANMNKRMRQRALLTPGQLSPKMGWMVPPARLELARLAAEDFETSAERWCGGGESNPYTFRCRILSAVRLPIPPPPPGAKLRPVWHSDLAHLLRPFYSEGTDPARRNLCSVRRV